MENSNTNQQLGNSTEVKTITVGKLDIRKKLINYFMLGILFVLLTGVVAIVAWAALDSRNANNSVGVAGGNQNLTNSSTDADKLAKNTSTAVNSNNQSSSNSTGNSKNSDLPNGWQLLTDEKTGVKYGLPIQSSYASVNLNPVNDKLAKEWYVVPNYFSDQAEEEVPSLWGLKFFNDILTFRLANYPGRQESSNFACGGLCANQDEIIISMDRGNKDSVQSLVNSMRQAVDAYNAVQEKSGSDLRVKINNLQTIERWGAGVATYILEFTGGMGDDASSNYYLVANGRNAYSITTFGVNKNIIEQVLNTLVFP